MTIINAWLNECSKTNGVYDKDCKKPGGDGGVIKEQRLSYDEKKQVLTIIFHIQTAQTATIKMGLYLTYFNNVAASK